MAEHRAAECQDTPPVGWRTLYFLSAAEEEIQCIGQSWRGV